MGLRNLLLERCPWNSIRKGFERCIRKDRAMETKLVYDAKWCSGEKLYQRLLQKPSKSSKSKDHLVSLERRLKLREEANISNLLHEWETIQERIKLSKKGVNIEKIFLKFKNITSKSNANGTLKLLRENMSNGILPLNDKTLKLLKQKHPEANEPLQDVLTLSTPLS